MSLSGIQTYKSTALALLIAVTVHTALYLVLNRGSARNIIIQDAQAVIPIKTISSTSNKNESYALQSPSAPIEIEPKTSEDKGSKSNPSIKATELNKSIKNKSNSSKNTATQNQLSTAE